MRPTASRTLVYEARRPGSRKAHRLSQRVSWCANPVTASLSLPSERYTVLLAAAGAGRRRNVTGARGLAAASRVQRSAWLSAGRVLYLIIHRVEGMRSMNLDGYSRDV